MWALPAPAAMVAFDAGVGVGMANSSVEPADGCHATETGYTCFYGPVSVPAGESVEIQDLVDVPPVPGYVTGMRATLVDPSGDKLAHHMVHLHHAVWINPNKDDTT